MKQCLYFLCMFLCSKKSSNVFSCWVQRRDCPGKPELLWRGRRTRNPLCQTFTLLGPALDSWARVGSRAQVALHLQQFVFQECARPAGSHRINEAKRGNEENNNNKNHECNQDTLTCKGRMKIFVLRFCKKYLYTWPHFSQNSECCTLFTLLPLPLGPPLTTQGWISS